MPSTSDSFITQITETIVSFFHPQSVILFGSYARGDENSRSDLDIIVVFDQPFKTGALRLEVMTALWQALKKFHISKDILVYSQDEIEQWKTSKNHVIGRAYREGKVLYDRP